MTSPFVCPQCRRPIGPTDLSLNGLHAECAREREQRRILQENQELARKLRDRDQGPNIVRNGYSVYHG